ncbi:MAG: hypothetical protein R3E32_13450 [Chitinophagales bacterium]
MQVTKSKNHILIEIPVEVKIDDSFFAELKFQLLAQKWKEESKFFSFTKDIVQTESYQAILKMGNTAIPFILKELEKKPKHWFYALKHLTKENPIQESSKGNLQLMTKDWMQWGKRNNLL